MTSFTYGVVAGLDPAIHRSSIFSKRMDARVRPAHDGGVCCSFADSLDRIVAKTVIKAAL